MPKMTKFDDLFDEAASHVIIVLLELTDLNVSRSHVRPKQRKSNDCCVKCMNIGRNR